MNNGILFADLTMPSGVKLSDCKLVGQVDTPDYRLYVEPCKNGFYAMAIEFATSSVCDDIWACPNLRVSELFTVTAYNDGVRHLEFKRDSDDEAGYIYYPDMIGLSKFFTIIGELEKTYLIKENNQPRSIA